MEATNPTVTVITASCRPQGLQMLHGCLTGQTRPDWEWLIVAPPDMAANLRRFVADPRIRLLDDPPRRPGDFYRLNGAWNAAVREAKADLLVFLCDWIWFEPDALDRFVERFLYDPRRGVSSVGHHYRRIVNGRPEVQWTTDGRLPMLANVRHSYEGFPPVWMELAFAALPRAGVLEVGGFDEKYDAVAGASEKDLCCRMYAAGYRFLFDELIECRNYTHEKAYLRSWDDAYADAEKMFKADLEAIAAGDRMRV